MPNTLADVLRAGVRERARTGVPPFLKVGMDPTSMAPDNEKELNDLPNDLLRRINDETRYCNGPLFHLQWVKQGRIFMYSIRGFERGTPSATVMRIRDALDAYWAELYKEKTGRDLVWLHRHSPSQENPTGNGTNWMSKNVESADLSFALCREWAHSVTNRMIRDLGYSLERSSETAPARLTGHDGLGRQTLVVNFDICWWFSKRLDPVMRGLKEE